VAWCRDAILGVRFAQLYNIYDDPAAASLSNNLQVIAAVLVIGSLFLGMLIAIREGIHDALIAIPEHSDPRLR